MPKPPHKLSTMVKRASSASETPRDGRFTNIRAVLFPEAMQNADKSLFSPFAEIDIHVRNLPHWAQDGTLIFVTFRLADSLPQEKLREWEAEKEAWLRGHPEPWDEETRREYAQSFPQRLQDYLDAGYGSCILARKDCRDTVESALEHFNGNRYDLHAYVVMPNHVHVLMALAAKDDLSAVMHSWKSYTANILNRLCGTSGAVWRKESYDRLIRNSSHYRKVIEYITDKNAKGQMVKRASSAFEANAQDGRSTTGETQ